MEKGSVDETLFCSFATNKNVADPGEAGSSPNLAKMVVTGWLAGRNERIIKEGPPPTAQAGRISSLVLLGGSRVTQEARVN